MALADLLKPSSPEALRKKLSTQLMDAQHALAEARDAWESAEADILQDVGDAAAAARAHALVEQRRMDVEKIRAGLSALDSRTAAATLGAARATREAQWNKVDQAVTARTKAAQRMRKVAEEFATVYLELLHSTGAMQDSLKALDLKPAPDADAALLWAGHIESFARTELRRLGVEWAAPAVYGVVNLPEFVSKFEATRGLVQSWKAADRG